uniref:Ovule protein n=1 Tax=Parascaris univalens TaxID=6257 RepID=A0A915B3W1_PARUN
MKNFEKDTYLHSIIFRFRRLRLFPTCRFRSLSSLMIFCEDVVSCEKVTALCLRNTSLFVPSL